VNQITRKHSAEKLLEFESTMHVGDLVGWCSRIGSSSWKTAPFYSTKNVAIVLSKRIATQKTEDGRTIYIPEVLVIWDDNEKTNSSENSLRLLNRSYV